MRVCWKFLLYGPVLAVVVVLTVFVACGAGVAGAEGMAGVAPGVGFDFRLGTRKFGWVELIAGFGCYDSVSIKKTTKVMNVRL